MIFVHLFEYIISQVLCARLDFSTLSPASPFTSVCSRRDQPLLGTLVVVTLQLPCEREVVKGKDGRGEKRKG